jgi:hypothetical protein
MADEHGSAIPIALEQLIHGMSELESVLGDAGKKALPVIRSRLIEAMAARDRGDPVATMQAVGAAMQQLGGLADNLDPVEGQMMRAVANRFQQALMRGDMPEAKSDMEQMFERSGARSRPKS